MLYEFKLTVNQIERENTFIREFVQREYEKFAAKCCELKENVLKSIIGDTDPKLWVDRITFVRFETDIEKEWLCVDGKYIGYFIIESWKPMSLHKKCVMYYVYYAQEKKEKEDVLHS